MGKSSEQHLQMRDDEVNGVPMKWSTPKTTGTESIKDYSLNQFEYITAEHSKLSPEIRDAILKAIKDFKKIMNTVF